MNRVFLLAHQDDEMGVFTQIKEGIIKNDNIYIFFLTNGNISKITNNSIIAQREKESLNVLKILGVKKKNIFFLGKNLKINSYELHKKLNEIYLILERFLKELKNDSLIYTHAWEGGNTDHDSCYVLTLKLLKKFFNKNSGFQFSLYNSANMPFKFYKVMHPIKNNGKILTKNINLHDKILFIYLLFYYKSQYKIWLGLYPFVIGKILFNNYGSLQVINPKKLLKKPHKKNLWYEKRGFLSYSSLKFFFDKFLNNIYR